MKEFTAEVTDVRLEGLTGERRRWRLLLTHTLFRGADGVLIAFSKNGTRLEIPVLGVVSEGTDAWHVVEKPLAAGTRVTGQVPDFGEQNS